jgi:SAM-dependent methyltransferase
MENKYDLSWEDIVYEMQNLPEFSRIISDWYLSMNLEENCERYFSSPEFGELMKIIGDETSYGKSGSRLKLLDLAAANGIASYSFAKSGFEVTSLESSSSRVVGLGAIEYIRDKYGLDIKTRKFDERKIPYDDGGFDVVFERQYLHHAFNMEDLLKEISRVLKPGGLFLGIREHVVDNHGAALKKFYRTHPIHRTYGHERAYKYSYYADCIAQAGLELVYPLKPFDYEMNIFEGSYSRLKERIFGTGSGAMLKKIAGEKAAFKLGILMLKIKYRQGRMYGFVAKKNKKNA